ncbi:MAG: hypothetical protein PHN82_02205 [bacterium]|nr:hypothetical protein [bacterium]
MRTTAVVFLAVASLAASSPLHAAIDRLQKEDGPRFVVGIMRLYYNIGKWVVEYGRDVALGLPRLPMAIATDIFQVGQQREPDAYYMTERELEERDRQLRREERMRRREKEEAAEAAPDRRRPSLTTIRE